MKVTIVETSEELIELSKLSETTQFVVVPLFQEYVHPVISDPVVVFLKPIELDDVYVIGISHSECLSPKFDFENIRNSFVYNKKYFNLSNSIDIDSIYYIQNIDYDDDFIKNINDIRIYPIYKLIDSVSPLLKVFSIECSKYDQLLIEQEKPIKFLNQVTIPTLAQMESYGIRVSPTFAHQNLIINGLVFSQYNHLTVTGRPSNRYGGVNFSALNKSDSSRTPFISRYDNGSLFLLDYDSYHLRLIAKLINYDLPKDSVHTYFAKQYFQTDNITEEMYEESKKISFRMLYGGILAEYKHVKFFQEIQTLLDNLWESHQSVGYVPSIISGIKITADSKTKLFNYIIQNYETEQNMLVLRKILIATKSFKSVPVLYTYDSLLFDVDSGESTAYIELVKDIMEMEGTFPVKISCGKNYGDMQKM